MSRYAQVTLQHVVYILQPLPSGVAWGLLFDRILIGEDDS